MNYKCTYSGTATYIGNGQYQNPVTGETTTGAEYALRYNCASQGGGCTSEVFSGDYFNDVDPGTEYLEEVTINVQDPKSYQRAVNKIMADIESRGWHQRMVTEAQGGGVDANDYINRTNLFYTGLGIIGSYKYKTGIYKQTNGKIGNFHNVKSANAKANLNWAKSLKKVGIVGNAITLTQIGWDVRDGQIQTSNIVNGALMGVGIAATMFLAAPAAAVIGTGILIYGVADYAFDISEGLDKKYGQHNINPFRR